MAESKQTKLDKLAKRIVDEKVCPELAKGATQLVMGDGSPDADVVFIGEAPGKNEDIEGKPFVGAAGRFLNEMLEMIGLKRGDVYISNIVKYRPPNNRDPSPEEKAAFLPFLKQQLDIIKPKLIVTLGRHSMEVLLPGLKISQVHGQPKRIKIRSSLKNWTVVGGSGEDGVQGDNEKRANRIDDTKSESRKQSTQQSASSSVGVSSLAGKQDATTWVILPLFHPAAALYNGGLRQTLIDDFSKIPLILQKI